MSLTGYGPRRTLIFDGDESEYELWEVKFLGHLRLQKLYDVVVPRDGESNAPDAEKMQMRLQSWFNAWTTEVWL